MKVMLDAGHGGKYPGTANGTYVEKDLMLTLTLYIATLFKKRGVDVLLTRDKDVSMELMDRTNLENMLKPDCFISFHLDGGVPSACGPTVWLHTNAPKSYEQWGRDILDGLYNVGITTNRNKDLNKGMPGNAKINYHVNQYTKCPSMLLELGFLTNDTNLMEFLQNYKEYAEAVVNATCVFLGIEGLAEDKADTFITIEQLALELKNKGIESIKIGG